MQHLPELYHYFLRAGKISTDTRNDVSGSIFFALSGANFNGNEYAKYALENGAILAVIDQKEYNLDDRYFFVEDSLETLQELARLHRSKMNCQVIGITGSNGKTTTKELIANVLTTERKINSTKGNLNNHIGVPLTILSIETNTEIAIVEMGANHKGEIALLCNIAQPQFGIITNIGKAHLEGFGSFEGVKEAKNELYDFLKSSNGLAFVNEDDSLLMDLSKELKRTTYGPNSKFSKAEIKKFKPFLNISWEYNSHNYLCRTKLFGQYNADNIYAAIATGIHFGISPENINNAIANYQPENNRSQLVKTETNLLIMDAYNANPVSMSGAIENFIEYQPNNPWLILGDMFELGNISREEHKKIIDLLKESLFENILLVGKEFFSLRSNNSFVSFPNLQDADNYLAEHPIRNAEILVKGSRGIELEKLLKHL